MQGVKVALSREFFVGNIRVPKVANAGVFFLKLEGPDFQTDVNQAPAAPQ